MAKIPVYDSLQVAPSNVPQVQFAQQGNLFGGLSHGLQQAGAGMMEVAALQKREKEKADNTQALMKFNQFREESQADLQKFGNIPGMDAQAKSEEYRQRQAALKAKYRNELSHSQDALNLFDVNAIGVEGNANSYINAHVTKESNKVSKVVENDAMDGHTRLALDNALVLDPKTGKPLARDNSLEAADAVLWNQIKRENGDNEQSKSMFKAQSESRRSGFHTTVIEGLIGKDQTANAQKYYDNNKDSIQAEERIKLEDKLSNVTDYRAATDKAVSDIETATASNKDQIKNGDTTALLQLKRDAPKLGLSEKGYAIYMSHLNNSIATANDMFVEKTNSKNQYYTKRFIDAKNEQERSKIYMEAVAADDTAIALAANSATDKLDRITVPDVNANAKTTIIAISDGYAYVDLKTGEESVAVTPEQKVNALRLFNAQLQEQRAAFSQADWEYIKILYGSESLKHMPEDAKKEDKDVFIKMATVELDKTITNKDSREYKDALSIVYQKAYGDNVTKEDLSAKNVKQFLNEVMVENGKKAKTIPVVTGDGFFAKTVINLPFGELPAYYDNPKSIRRDVKVENLPTLNTSDDINKMSQGVTSLLNSVSKPNHLLAQVVMQSLGDYEQARVDAFNANNQREAPESDILNLLLDKHRSRVAAVEEARKESKRQEALRKEARTMRDETGVPAAWRNSTTSDTIRRMFGTEK